MDTKKIWRIVREENVLLWMGAIFLLVFLFSGGGGLLFELTAREELRPYIDDSWDWDVWGVILIPPTIFSVLGGAIIFALGWKDDN